MLRIVLPLSCPFFKSLLLCHLTWPPTILCSFSHLYISVLWAARQDFHRCVIHSCSVAVCMSLCLLLNCSCVSGNMLLLTAPPWTASLLPSLHLLICCNINVSQLSKTVHSNNYIKVAAQCIAYLLIAKSCICVLIVTLKNWLHNKKSEPHIEMTKYAKITGL